MSNYIKSSVQEMYDRINRGDFSPYTINEAPEYQWGNTAHEQRPNPGFTAGEQSNAEGQPLYTQAQLDDIWASNFSPLTKEQYAKTKAAMDSIPGSFIDALGRLIVPGTQIKTADGGKIVYDPFDAANDRHFMGIGADDPVDPWKQYNSKGERAQGIYGETPLQNAGIKVKEEWGGAIGQGGWNAIRGILGTAAAGIGGAMSGSTGTLGGSSITLSEAVQAGATASDLSAMGFNAAQIATQGSAVAANELAAQGINSGLASGIVAGAKGAVTSSAMGGNPLTGVLQGAGSSAVNSGGDWFSDFLGSGGDGMDGDIFDVDSGLYDTGDSFSDMYTYDGINPAGSVGDVTGGANVNWGKIFTAALGAGMSVAAATQAANAQAGAANSAANASTQAAQTAAAATLQGTREGIAAQERALATSRSDFAPFLQPADRALATLQSSVYGEPVQYQPRTLADLGRIGATAPTQPLGVNSTAPAYNTASSQYGGLTSKQIMDMAIGIAPNPNNYTVADALKVAQGSNGAATPLGSITPTTGTQTANAEKFDLANFRPEQTAAFDWQKKRNLEDLRTQLMMMGRPSGTVAANANERSINDLNAREYDSGYNRLLGQKQDYQNSLLNLVKIGQGAAGSTSASGQNAANNISNAFQNQGANLANIATTNGNNQANAALTRGASTANLWSGLSALPFQAANTAIQGGWKPFA